MCRTAVVTAALGAVVLAGCTTGSDGGGSGSTAPATSAGPVSPTPTVSGTASATVTPSGSTSASTSASATGSTTLSPPAVPTVPSTYPGAFTLTSGGTPVTGYLTSVDCRQDGSMTADQLTLSPGARSVTLTAQPIPGEPITIAGSAELDAAGGIFRGADTRGAITVVWTC